MAGAYNSRRCGIRGRFLEQETGVLATWVHDGRMDWPSWGLGIDFGMSNTVATYRPEGASQAADRRCARLPLSAVFAPSVAGWWWAGGIGERAAGRIVDE